MTSTLFSNCLLYAVLLSQFVFTAFAGETPLSLLTTLNSKTYGPIERDCKHERIVCIEGNNTIFAVKGPLTEEQVKQLCPTTPRQTQFKRNRLPHDMVNPMIIVNVGNDIIAYTQHKNSIEKITGIKLPEFSYLLCGTSEHKPGSGKHAQAERPMSFDTFITKSVKAEQITNTPSNEIFKADHRKYASQNAALGDSLAYVQTLFASTEVNYLKIDKKITGYLLNSADRDITARFDNEERLFELTATIKEESASFSDTLNGFVEQYGKPVVKGSSSIDHDLDPNNEVDSGTYIWKISTGSYLTISIDSTKSISVKMVDINQTEKAAQY